MTENIEKQELKTKEELKAEAKAIKEKQKVATANHQRRSSIKAGDKGLFLSDLASGMEIAKNFALSDVLPKAYYSGINEQGDKRLIKVAARALVAMQLGAEVGLPPMQSIKAVTFVNDMPVVWGDAQLALVRASGLLEDRVETYDPETKTAMCSMTRAGGEVCSHSFSNEDARAAKLLTKDNWSKYEKRMLQLRARAFCIRDLFTDVLGGLTHTAEEMSGVDFNNQQYKSEPMRDAAVEDSNIFAEKTIAALEDTKTVDIETKIEEIELKEAVEVQDA